MEEFRIDIAVFDENDKEVTEINNRQFKKYNSDYEAIGYFKVNKDRILQERKLSRVPGRKYSIVMEDRNEGVIAADTGRF